MHGLKTEGSRAALLYAPSPKRKLSYTLELLESGTDWVGVNTARPNRIVEEAIAARRIAPLRGYSGMKREVKYGVNSRIDLLLTDKKKALCYVEVKNVTLKDGRFGIFPDAVSTRGLKHLEELQAMVNEGHRAVMLFLVNRRDCAGFGAADAVDPTYAEALRRVSKGGVEVLAYRTAPDPTGIAIDRKIPCDLERISTLTRD